MYVQPISWAWWHLPVIPATQEAQVQDHSPRQAQAKVQNPKSKKGLEAKSKWYNICLANMRP
jgi:hypothetical protein